MADTERDDEMAITANPNGSWSERNIAAIADCVDSAFAAVLSAEFDRLTAGMSRNQIDTWLYRSERNIGLLRSGGDMPNYCDPMVVLRYVIQYHLGHINLAYTLVKNSNSDRRLTNTGRLQVVDFGAGTLAMSFGMALAAADALADGENITTLMVDAIDTGRPMMELGLKLWTEFANEVSQRHGMEPLAKAVQLIRHSLHDNHRSVQELDNSDCWLSSLHTIYDDNEATVRFALTTLCGTLDPNLMILTCFAGKSHIANRVVPTGRDWQRGRDPQLRFNGFIDNSQAAGVAFDRSFQPTTWYNCRLYTDPRDVATFISRAEVSRPAPTPSQPSPEAERLRERQRREAQERARQRRQQEEARRRSDRVEHQGQQERWRKIQEEARQCSEQERQQRRQEGEAQRHSIRGIPSKIRSGLSLLFRRRRK